MARRGGRARPFIAGCLYATGVVPLVRWWARAAGPRLVILNYHRASSGDLRSHFAYLRRHYRVVSLEEGLRELFTQREGESRQRAGTQTPLVVTFDDGYRDTYTHAFAVACELQVPITVFLIPGYVEQGDRFWWEEGRRLAYGATVREVTLDERTYRLDGNDQREALARSIDARVRYAASIAEREAFLSTMREVLAVPADVSPEEQLALPMSWSVVREMAASRWVSFGAHTMHHPILAHLADPGEARWEVAESRKVLEQQLGRRVTVLAYPVGRVKDIGAQGLAAAQAAGFDAALTTVAGSNTPGADPFLLHRVGTDVQEHWLVLAAQAAGVWNTLLRIERRVRRPLVALGTLGTRLLGEGPAQRPRAPRGVDTEGRTNVHASWPVAERQAHLRTDMDAPAGNPSRSGVAGS
jgi:peptidoglycan/xylan/chitin deacetylase (PgdA/CDA1 family)